MKRTKKLRFKRRTSKRKKNGGMLDSSKESRKSRQQAAAEQRETKKQLERAERLREETERRQRQERRKTLKKAREEATKRKQQETAQHTWGQMHHTLNHDIVTRELEAAARTTDPDMRTIHLANAQLWHSRPVPPPQPRILFPPSALLSSMKNKDGVLDTRSQPYINWIWENYVAPQVTQAVQQSMNEHSEDSPELIANYAHMTALSTLNSIYRANIETPDGLRRIPGQTIFGLEQIINRLYGTSLRSKLKLLTIFYMNRPDLINEKVINRLTKMYRDVDQRESLTHEQQVFLERLLDIGSGSGI